MACVWLGMGSCFMTAQADEPLTVKFRSRALLDAAVSGYGKESVQGYYRLEDFRVGFKATYRQYEMKADWFGRKQSSHQGFVVELSL